MKTTENSLNFPSVKMWTFQRALRGKTIMKYLAFSDKKTALKHSFLMYTGNVKK